MVEVGLTTPEPSFVKRVAFGVIALGVAAAIWLPAVHFLFRRDSTDYYRERAVPPRAQKLAERQVYLWTDPASRALEIQRMRAANAEWDLMGRTFVVLSLANMALRESAARDQHLRVVDGIIDETLGLEATRGHLHFSMPYARAKPFVLPPARSLFVDGEIALMLAARCAVAERADYVDVLARRVELLVDRMSAGPLLCAESYPDECWMFDNTCALAAIRLADALRGTDRADFFARWLDTARTKLVDPQTGLLISSFSLSGIPRDGPEGSSIWIVSHWLQLIDQGFAAEQYARAKKEFSETICGFGYSREWPASWPSWGDVDSGPVIPLLDVSPGASGTALVGASAFRDREFLGQLFTTLDFAAFPLEEGGALRYCASNQVGDAVILYATVLGPLWERVRGEHRP